MYVILHHLGFRKYPESCDLDQKWCNNKRNKMPYHWDSFFTLYYFHNISFLLTWIIVRSSTDQVQKW